MKLYIFLISIGLCLNLANGQNELPKPMSWEFGNIKI